MIKKKKGARPLVQPDAEVLKAARELPQTMKSRLCLKLRTETIEESIIHCLAAREVRQGRGFTLPIELHHAVKDIAALLTDKCGSGYLFSGRSGTGKTSIMLAISGLFNVLKKFPDSWKYQGINSIDSIYVSATNFCHPIISYEIFKDAAAIPVLFLDNLGYEIDGFYASSSMEYVRNIIAARYEHGLLTFIATPFDIQSIRETYGKQTASIIAENYRICEFECDLFKNSTIS